MSPFAIFLEVYIPEVDLPHSQSCPYRSQIQGLSCTRKGIFLRLAEPLESYLSARDYHRPLAVSARC